LQDISPEEKIQIAQHYLLNAPPGQYGAVLEDVKVVAGSELLSEEKQQEIAREFNTKNLRVLRDGENPPIVLSK
jgi:alpha-ketoglutarate-dependent taurine dioxygenase